MLELQLERQKRLQLERQLEEETLRRDELVEQEIRLRERQKVQVRLLIFFYSLVLDFGYTWFSMDCNFPLDGYPSMYRSRPFLFNFSDQTETGATTSYTYQQRGIPFCPNWQSIYIVHKNEIFQMVP